MHAHGVAGRQTVDDIEGEVAHDHEYRVIGRQKVTVINSAVNRQNDSHEVSAFNLALDTASCGHEHAEKSKNRAWVLTRKSILGSFSRHSSGGGRPNCHVVSTARSEHDRLSLHRCGSRMRKCGQAPDACHNAERFEEERSQGCHSATPTQSRSDHSCRRS